MKDSLLSNVFLCFMQTSAVIASCTIKQILSCLEEFRTSDFMKTKSERCPELESFNTIQNCKKSWETWICTKLYHLISLFFSSGRFNNLHFCNLIELSGDLVGLLSTREPKPKAKILLMDLQPNRAGRWLNQSSPQSWGHLCNPSSWNRFQRKALDSCSSSWPPALDSQDITWFLIWAVQAMSITAPLPVVLGLRTHIEKTYTHRLIKMLP